ncbi:TPA: hypothetical protein MIU58_27785, partial [Klebsiella pneumoniae]|nr:hypothetical protein [Klebsiella pneumoniae]HBY4518657.1 hypothetical protein [Klebsiella pneumoniae]
QKSLRNQPFKAGFLYLLFARGVSGVKRGRNPINNNYSGAIFLPKKCSIFCLLYFQNDYWR